MVMKTVIFSLVAVVALCAGVSRTAHAQNVAIIDLKKIFDQHARFQQNYELMKKEVEAAEQDIKGRQEGINTLIKKMNGFKVDSLEYKQHDDAITKMKADLSVLVTQHKKNFARREANIYNTAYVEVMKEVEYFCVQNKIDLVLRFNSDLMGENNIQSSSDPNYVAKQLNKPVVYANMRIDITDIVIKSVNRTQISKQPPGPGGVPRSK